MPNLFLSTCGTSLLTNRFRDEPSLSQTANLTHDQLTPEQLEKINSWSSECESLLSNSDLPSVRRLSAELNGLLTFYDNNLSQARADHHILLHTDTYQGAQVASLLEKFLRSQGCPSLELLSFPQLRTSSLDDFQHGVSGLIKWCAVTLPGYRDSQYHIVFNLTGGFKSLQGWMQTLGMFYADEIIYIFESGKELIRIPRIPVAIDSAATIQIRSNLALFRLVSLKIPLPEQPLVPSSLPEAFFYRLCGEVDLSPWGRLLWERAQAELYPLQVHDSPTPRVVFSEKFRRAAQSPSLNRDRIKALNERIDDLARFQLSGGQNNLRRLDLKRLEGNPMPPSTHEVDAWSLPGAWRIFCHFDGDRLILDDLTEHL